MNEPRPPFLWRSLTSVLLAAAFGVLVLTGVMLFVAPPGRIANWTNWTLLGLLKHDWISLHVWFSVLFLLVAIVHLVFNWRPMLNHLKNRLTRRLGFRREWLVALGVCGGVFAGTRLDVPPFSSLIAFNERIKESWDQPRERAPIPHAELLTLAELAQRAGVDLATATNRLARQGLTNLAAELVVQTLADHHNRSAQQIYQAILAPSASGAARVEAGHGPGQGRGGSGGAGGGPGRKTLKQFCAEEGIELKDALARLKAKGFTASEDLTLREIAVNNGFSRPYDLIDLIRPK
jgi:hypothetical protein